MKNKNLFIVGIGLIVFILLVSNTNLNNTKINENKNKEIDMFAGIIKIEINKEKEYIYPVNSFTSTFFNLFKSLVFSEDRASYDGSYYMSCCFGSIYYNFYFQTWGKSYAPAGDDYWDGVTTNFVKICLDGSATDYCAYLKLAYLYYDSSNAIVILPVSITVTNNDTISGVYLDYQFKSTDDKGCTGCYHYSWRRLIQDTLPSPISVTNGDTVTVTYKFKIV